MNQETTFFWDFDGVIVDFEQGFVDLFGKKHSELHVGVMWKLINTHETFWHNLPAMPDAQALIAKMATLNSKILTGCPPGEVAFSKADYGKRVWAEREIPFSVPVITCLSKNKPNHILQKGDVLIDDIIKNCNRWTEAGGRAILHTSAADTLRQLEAMGY